MNDDDQQENMYDSAKRRKLSSDEEDQAPPSRILPSKNTIDIPDSSIIFNDSYEQQFQSHFYDPSLYTSPYSRFTPTYPFACTPMASTPTGTNPFSFASTAAGRYTSPYSFSSSYYQYPTSS